MARDFPGRKAEIAPTCCWEARQSDFGGIAQGSQHSCNIAFNIQCAEHRYELQNDRVERGGWQFYLPFEPKQPSFRKTDKDNNK